MKTKIFSGVTIVAIAAVVAFNVSLSKQTSNQASQLVLANVEALAQDGEFVFPELKGLKEEGVTVQCSLPGTPMWGGLAISCRPYPSGSCTPYDPCNLENY